MSIVLKRAYETASPGDGYRVLVDRLWPRGVSRDRIALAQWLKEVAPSDALRRDFHSGDLDWNAFRRAYLSELKSHRDALRPLAWLSRQQRLTLVYSANDAAHNNAVVVKQYLKMLGAR